MADLPPQNTALDFAWDFEARRALRLAMKRSKVAAELVEAVG